jgi:hypothetical protein
MNRQELRRRLRAEIRAAADALRRDWDPIGQGQMPDLPADEYEAYAPHVVSLIESGADDGAIAAYLRRLEDDTIGVASGEDLVVVAGKLRRAVAAAFERAG